ncbi:MAG TPA: hypothetical protein VKB08_18870 [Bradyrhizobium sp.]|nr:hypothetical protein [Bradyrhizobium sp.]
MAAMKNVLNLIKFDELSSEERGQLKKILEDRKRELKEAIQVIDQALAKKPKSKGTAKR